jgi:hypothetical protein
MIMVVAMVVAAAAATGVRQSSGKQIVTCTFLGLVMVIPRFRSYTNYFLRRNSWPNKLKSGGCVAQAF